MHEGRPQWYKLCSWVDVERVGKNGVSVHSVRAFVKKKDARGWLKKQGESYSHLVIKSAIIQ